jgi:hypothetical protein
MQNFSFGWRRALKVSRLVGSVLWPDDDPAFFGCACPCRQQGIKAKKNMARMNEILFNSRIATS